MCTTKGNKIRKTAISALLKKFYSIFPIILFFVFTILIYYDKINFIIYEKGGTKT